MSVMENRNGTAFCISYVFRPLSTVIEDCIIEKADGPWLSWLSRDDMPCTSALIKLSQFKSKEWCTQKMTLVLITLYLSSFISILPFYLFISLHPLQQGLSLPFFLPLTPYTLIFSSDIYEWWYLVQNHVHIARKALEHNKSCL